MKNPLRPKPADRDSDEVALLVIDVQQGLFRKSAPIYRAQELLGNITTLIDRAHESGVPVIYIQHASKKTWVEGSDDWQLHPRLQCLNMDLRIPKQHGSAFKETTLKKS